MTYEEEILAKHSTPNLRRNILPRHAKKLNMEFDAQYNKMTKAERDEFLDALYPDETSPKEPPHDPTGLTAPVRPAPRDGSPGVAEKAEAEASSEGA